MKKTGAMGATPTKPIGKIVGPGSAAKPAAAAPAPKSTNPISRLGAYAHPPKKKK